MKILGRLVTPNAGVAPASPVKGEMYFDTVSGTLLYWNGTAWISGGSGGSGSGGSGGGAAGSGASFSTTIGNGVGRTFTVTHGMGTRNVNVGVYQTASPYSDVTGGVEYERTSADTVTIRTSVGVAALAQDEYTVVVTGPGASLTAQAMDVWHVIGTTGEPAFQNGWVNFGSGLGNARFRKGADGRVNIAGSIKTGANSTVAFTLPVGYRPTSAAYLPIIVSGGLGYVLVNTDGSCTVSAITGSAVTQTLLDGVEFDTDSVTTLPAGPAGTSGNSWTALIGDGTSKTFTITHGLGTRNVNVAVYQTASPYSEVEAEIERTSPNIVTVKTATTQAAPTTGQYTVSISGPGAAVSAQTMDTWHSVGGSGEPAFQNSWANTGSGFQPLQFRKYPDGTVRVRGVISTGATSTTVFTLPVGYRPQYPNYFENVLLDSYATGGGLNINTDGTFVVTRSTSTRAYIDTVFDTDTATTLPAGPPGGQSYTQTFGDGANRSFVISHNLASWNVNAFVRETNSPRAYVPAEIEYTDQNTITIRTGTALAAPGVGQYTVVVNGAGAAISQQTNDTWHLVGDATTGLGTTFGSGWVQYPGEVPVAFRKDPLGKVELRGVAQKNSAIAANESIFTLPVGYRPPVTGSGFQRFPVSINLTTIGAVYFASDGRVMTGQALASTSYIDLANLEFDTDLVTTLPAGPQGVPGGTTISAVIGDGTNRVYTVDHNMATRNVAVQVYENIAPYADVTSSVEFERNSLNQVTLRFNPALSPPSQNQYTVVVNASGALTLTQQTLDGWHVVGAAGEPAWASGWSTAETVAFRKDAAGHVIMRGGANAPAVIANGNSIAFTLPVGFRPSVMERFVVLHGYGPVLIRVEPDGTVRMFNTNGLTGSGTASTVYFDPIEFDTDSVTTMLAGPQGAPGPAGNLPALVSVLPTTNLSEGLEIYFQTAAMAVDGAVWHLRYNAASSSPYKWEFVGGSSLYSLVGADQQQVTLSTWGELATVGPDVVLPLAGDYEYEASAMTYTNTVGGTCAFGLAAFSGTPGTDEIMYDPVSIATASRRMNLIGKLAAQPAATTIRMRYWHNSGTANFNSRKLRVRPVRVG